MGIEQSIEELLAIPPYSQAPQQRQCALLALLKNELEYASERNPRFRNYVNHWPVDFRAAERISDLPFLPVGVFKLNPPLALVDACEIKRTLASSATTGQVPSRVVLDAATARRMTKGVVAIIRDFIGPARRPYLVIDTSENMTARTELGARAAAIQASGIFRHGSCLLPAIRSDEENRALIWRSFSILLPSGKTSELLVYGFTHVIWTQLVQPLQSKGITLGIPQRPCAAQWGLEASGATSGH